MGIAKGEGTVKANLVLRVDPATLQQPVEPQPGPSQNQVLKRPQALLTKPGQFMLTQDAITTASHIDYRSRRCERHSFRVNQQVHGYFINVAGWSIDEKPFDSIQALVSALNTQPGLEQVSA